MSFEETAGNQYEYMMLGEYPQGKNGEVEPIKWRVLKKEGTKVFLISEYGLEAFPYHMPAEDVTWEKCAIRKWLNNEFINSAFNSDMQSAICFTNVKAAYQYDETLYHESDTVDKIFLLSDEEANTLFKSAEERFCITTPYAKEHKARTDKSGICWWWLRTRVKYEGRKLALFGGGAFFVDEFGWVFKGCAIVNDGRLCVRPALWIDLAKL